MRSAAAALCVGLLGCQREQTGAGREMSVAQESSEPVDDSEPDVFEIVLPITVLVLSDDDFLPGDSEEQAVLVPKSKEEDELEVNLNSSVLLQSNGTPSNDSNSISIWEENKTASNEDNSMTCAEEKQVTGSVCNKSELSLTDGCGAGTDENQNYVFPTSSCKTQLSERNEASDREKCDGGDGSQNIPPLFSAGIKGRDDTIKTNSQLTLAEMCKHEEKPVSVANGGSQEKQPEIHKEIETIVEMKDPDSSVNGDNEASNSKRKRSKFEDETLGSLLEHGLKEEPQFTYNCSDLFLDGCCSTSEELLKEVGKPEMSAFTSAESNTTGEHIYKTLSPFPKKRRWQEKVISPHASRKESQNQQEGLACLSNFMTIKPLPKASSSTNKHERLNSKCRFCSSVYKCSAHLKKHLYSAHKDKKMYKCCFCKRTFFFSVNLKNHLKLHKKITRLKKARKNRKNVRKVGERRSEERQSETKKKESKYDKFFSKMERGFTPLSVPVSFSCRICFFASSNPRVFIHHMKGHKERPPYQCPQCDYSCVSLSYLLNHMYWHAGYKLYQCRFCTFFSLYFASMVRHSYIHTGARPYSCEFCQSEFTNTTALKRHKRLHAGKETCQGQQLDLATGRKRTQRPVKNYTCDECNMVFYTKGHLSFHKKFHEQFKASGYTNQSSEYHKRKICKADSDSQETVCLSGDEENDFLGGGVLAPAVDSKQKDGVRDSKKMRSRKKFSENSHGSSSLPIGNRSEVPLNSHHMEAVIFKEEPLFNSKASHSQVQDDDAYRKYVENLKVTWPSNLSAFKTYRCQHCSYATTVHSNFRLHLELHTDERQFVCKECDRAFKTSNDLQKHSLIHVKNGYEFGRCFYVNSCLEDLEWHCEMHVGMCPERDFGSSEGSNSVHSLLGSEDCGLQPYVQGGEENDLLAPSQPQYYQCAECEYTTYILSNLKLHVRTHTGERPYSCSVCQKKFRTSSHLKRHRVMHYNSDYLKCRSCDYSTNKWLSLKQHLASHSCEESSSTGCLYEQKQLPVKTYTCEECGYCTVHNGNLKLHMRIHTGEKPFKCSQCGLAFCTSSHLKRHLVTHLKLHCGRCKFSTVDKRAFQKHVKTHKGKHKCGKCNGMLPTKKLLEQHNQQHELEI
ncbi:zinc finger protein 26-like [Strigops habroptila]|uniref:Zinc finger protein 26-like n=1 Tax=Strigops habroptila TaxID=2489341 RepID=A0A672UFJ7_STRHB|nr:zinc finger protein 26-like [Strigops habroptila]